MIDRNEPRDILRQGFMQSAAPLVESLREAGWPVEITLDQAEDGTQTVSIILRLDSLPLVYPPETLP